MKSCVFFLPSGVDLGGAVMASMTTIVEEHSADANQQRKHQAGIGGEPWNNTVTNMFPRQSQFHCSVETALTILQL